MTRQFGSVKLDSAATVAVNALGVYVVGVAEDALEGQTYTRVSFLKHHVILNIKTMKKNYLS